MLARVAENLYWLGRYIERADNLARMVDVHRSIAPENQERGELDLILAALDATEEFQEAQAANPSLTHEDYLVFSVDSPVSIRAAVSNARRLARELREQISREVFEEINRLHLNLGFHSPRGVSVLVDLVRSSIPHVLGLHEHTLLRTEGAHWLNVGVFLERADMASRIIDVKYFVPLDREHGVGTAWDHSQWREVLRSASALEAHQKRHHGLLRVDTVVDVIVFEAEFPRSLLFCVDSLLSEFKEATERAPAARTLNTTKTLTLLDLELKATTADTVLVQGMHQFIDDVQCELATINDSMVSDIFDPDPSGA